MIELNVMKLHESYTLHPLTKYNDAPCSHRVENFYKSTNQNLNLALDAYLKKYQHLYYAIKTITKRYSFPRNCVYMSVQHNTHVSKELWVQLLVI